VAEYGLYAIFGYPLSHTYSPAMHNKAFESLGLNNYYIDIPVPPGRFKQMIRSLKNAPLSGFNLTVPHKEIILKALDSMDGEAKQIGAVNTVLVGPVDGAHNRKVHLIGYNTDAYGFREALRKEGRFNPRDKSILILGAGGAARACVYALIKEGAAKIIVANRTVSKAKKLINDFSKITSGAKKKLSALPLKKENLKRVLPTIDLIVNSTSLGLRVSDPLPIDVKLLPKKKRLLIFDLIYNPLQTKLLLGASKRGYQTMNGLSMLLYQGVRAFEIWTKKTAPIHVMRKALKEAMMSFPLRRPRSTAAPSARPALGQAARKRESN